MIQEPAFNKIHLKPFSYEHRSRNLVRDRVERSRVDNLAMLHCHLATMADFFAQPSTPSQEILAHRGSELPSSNFK